MGIQALGIRQRREILSTKNGLECWLNCSTLWFLRRKEVMPSECPYTGQISWGTFPHFFSAMQNWQLGSSQDAAGGMLCTQSLLSFLSCMLFTPSILPGSPGNCLSHFSLFLGAKPHEYYTEAAVLRVRVWGQWLMTPVFPFFLSLSLFPFKPQSSEILYPSTLHTSERIEHHIYNCVPTWRYVHMIKCVCRG